MMMMMMIMMMMKLLNNQYLKKIKCIFCLYVCLLWKIKSIGTNYLNEAVIFIICQSSSTGGTHGLMVISIGNRHDDPSSNPGRGCLCFT